MFFANYSRKNDKWEVFWTNEKQETILAVTDFYDEAIQLVYEGQKAIKNNQIKDWLKMQKAICYHKEKERWYLEVEVCSKKYVLGYFNSYNEGRRLYDDILRFLDMKSKTCNEQSFRDTYHRFIRQKQIFKKKHVIYCLMEKKEEGIKPLFLGIRNLFVSKIG